MKFTLIGGVKRRIKLLTGKIQKYFTKERKLAISMLSRIIGVILIMSVFPIGIIKVDAFEPEEEQKHSNVSLQLNVHNNKPKIIQEKEVSQIVIGESNYQKEKRIAEENKITLSQRDVVTREVERNEESRVYSVEPSFEEKRNLVKKVAGIYGIDWKILEAVWQVESGKSWHTSVRSYAGAQGPMQFMPGTWAAYGQDGNGDGIKDVNNAEDALHGAANYLVANGLAAGDVQRALFAYNRAQWYVDKVIAVANSIID
jgi:hypothetical protein